MAAEAKPLTMEVSSTDVAVEIAGMNKWYGDFHVLRDINLKVMRGERIVICGPSGSGKSTFLRCLNGLHPVSSGRVEVDGTRVDLASGARLRALRRDVGFVFQQFNLVGRLSLFSNVMLGALGRLPMWRGHLLDRGHDRVGCGLVDHVTRAGSAVSATPMPS